MVKRIVFAAVLVAALGMFAWTLRRFGRLLAEARPENRFDLVGKRIASVLAYFFGQKSVVQRSNLTAERAPTFVRKLGSKYHVIICWGFLLITVGTGELILQGIYPPFTL